MALPALSIGFSPCPNDTFIFHGLVSGLIPTPGFTLLPEIHADVETLNQWAMAGRLDITKLSFHALGHVLDEYVLLAAGAALGRGCGPLLVSRPDLDAASLSRQTIAVPGHYTTAAMLLRMYCPECRTVAMPFDRIMPALIAGEVGAGVIIHESRFTYQSYGLSLRADLGAWWEETAGCPIPLGGIVARRSLGPEVIAALERAIRASVQAANRDPNQARAYIMAHAQELDEEVISAHIGLYVNEYSLDLGREGMTAVREFMKRGHEAGLFSGDASRLRLTSAGNGDCLLG